MSPDTLETLRSLCYGHDTPPHVRKAARQTLWTLQAIEKATEHARRAVNPTDDDRACGILPADRRTMADEMMRRAYERVPRGFAIPE